MNILKCKIILTNSVDEVYLFTDLPCPFVKDCLPSQPNLVLNFETTYDTARSYVQQNFDIIPEVINARH